LSPPPGAGFVPTGAILPFAGTTAPAGFLMCDGTSYTRVTFPGLATALGCGGSSCAYGAADSTHFNVPDLRGRFLRGVVEAALWKHASIGTLAVTWVPVASLLPIPVRT
jgi:microcystin-dependent protein